MNTGWWTGYDPFFVAWDRALPFSPDGHYHICISYQGEGVIPKVQCFIVPPSGMTAKVSKAGFAASLERSFRRRKSPLRLNVGGDALPEFPVEGGCRCRGGALSAKGLALTGLQLPLQGLPAFLRSGMVHVDVRARRRFRGPVRPNGAL